MHTRAFAASAKQELYEDSIDSIMNMVATQEMNASSFVHMVEEAFEVDIILFSKDKFLIPPHREMYYKMKPSRPTIFIYEHMGSESDRAEYPQCEIIIRATATNVQDHKSLFSHDDPIVIGVFTKYHEYNKIYKFSVELPMLQIKKLPFISQRIDSYGKGRVYNLRFNDRVITMVSTPLPPFALPHADKLHRIDGITALKFCREHNLNVIRQRLDAGTVRELDITIGTTEATLLLNDDGGRLVNINIDPSKERFERIIDNRSSIMNEFIRSKKTAKLLLDYTKFIMSEYLLTNNVHEITPTIINTFVNKYVIIDPTVKYDITTTQPFFSLKNTFVRSGKLVIPSEELLKRLIFMIRLYLHTNKHDMLTFHRDLSIKDYYDDIDDYKLFKSQYLFDGNDAVKRLIANKDIRYVVVDKVKVGLDQPPYFFQNHRINSTSVYLAQNTDNFDTANATVYGWRTKRLNVAIEGAPRQKVSIYNYQNERDMVLIQQGPSDKEIVLGYKVDNIPRYTVLMKLEII
jgi:hypothetical protein